MRCVLDAEAVVALMERRHSGRQLVLAALEVSTRLRRQVIVPAVTLAELYRGPHRRQAVDSLLARSGARLVVRDTDRALARGVGAVLSAAGAGSEDMVDAHAVATCAEDGGGVVVTGDPDDLRRLSTPYPMITVVALP